MSKCGSESRNLLPTYSHSYFKFVPTLYFTTTWFNLWDQSRTCLFGFLCFNGVCGFLHVYSILVDRMFQVYVFVMFLYVSISRPCFKSRAYFNIKPMFEFKVYCSFYGLLFVSRNSNGLMFLWLYVSMFVSFIISIHSKGIHPKITSSFCSCLCFMYYTFNMCHIFIGCTPYRCFTFQGCL